MESLPDAVDNSGHLGKVVHFPPFGPVSPTAGSPPEGPGHNALVQDDVVQMSLQAPQDDPASPASLPDADMECPESQTVEQLEETTDKPPLHTERQAKQNKVLLEAGKTPHY